ncbi:MAG: hypothetical protein ACREO5_01370 [Candidatus Binatia bacterium]
MKRSKIILALLIGQIFCLFVPQTIFSQTEKLDIFEYTPPKGWTKTPKDGVTVYSDSNKTAGTFCVLTVYSSTPSFGSPQKDFASEWNELIVKPFKADANPKTENQTEDGWTTVSGAAQIESDGNRSYVIMTILSGYGRVVSTYAILNDQSYLEQIGAFLTSVKMDKAKAQAASKPSLPPPSAAPTAGNSAYLDFDPFPDKPYVQPQQPLLGRLKKTITLADLAGKWEIGGASVTSYFSSSSGNYSSTDTSFFGEWYTIHADGTFNSSFQGRTSNHTVRESDTGMVVLSGGTVTFKYDHKAAMRYQFVAYMDEPKGAAILTMIHIGDSSPFDAEGLRANCGHAHGYVTCLTGEEFMRRP